MGRELKRVPEGFDWPIGQTWSGYVSPFRFPPCTACVYPGSSRPTGLTREANALAATFYASTIGGDRATAKALAWHDKIGQAEVDHLVGCGRLKVWRGAEDWVSVPRSADEVNAAQRAPGLSGHDSVDREILIRFRCERLGIPIDCPACHGHGSVATPEQRAIIATWRPEDPPTVPWYQLWETITEGSPISPPFATPEMLARWCAEHPWGADERASYDDWLAFVTGLGSAPTFVATAGRLVSGVEDAGESRRGSRS